MVVRDLLGLFFIYGFLGWLAETLVAIVQKKRFLNRGYLNGPLCSAYGIAAVFMQVFFAELALHPVFLFIACAVAASITEWLSGKILEKFGYGKWWDYSDRKWNLDGYICLGHSLLWGVIGFVAVRYLNPVFKNLLEMVPPVLLLVILLVLLGILVIDAIGSYLILHHHEKNMPRIAAMNEQIDTTTRNMESRIYRYISNRISRAYPKIHKEKQKKEKKGFADGCNFYKLALLFVIGSFLGDITETIFCRLTEGIWMSRSSLVWGQFSIVWGLAILFATMLLYNKREKSDGYLFIFGTVLGGVYEYTCSVFTEIVFGKVFWDYSSFRFNLGGRINLLYCFFWGFAAVIWIKKCYPFFSKWIEKIPDRIGKILTWVLVVFMIVDMLVSASALVRYDVRDKGTPAGNQVEKWIDVHYPDAVMQRIYPKAKGTGH